MDGGTNFGRDNKKRVFIKSYNCQGFVETRGRFLPEGIPYMGKKKKTNRMIFVSFEHPSKTEYNYLNSLNRFYYPVHTIVTLDIYHIFFMINTPNI